MVWLSACGPRLETDASGRYLVSNGNDSGEGSLRYVIENMEGSGTIVIDSAVSRIVLEKKIEVLADLELVYEGEEPVVIEGAEDGALFFHDFVETVRIEGVAFEKAGTTAVITHGEFTLINGAFRDNGSALDDAPGAVDAYRGVWFEDVEFTGNYNTNVYARGGANFVLEDVVFGAPAETSTDVHRSFVVIEGTTREEARIVNATFDGERRQIGGVYFGGGVDLVVEDALFTRMPLASGTRGGALVVEATSGTRTTVRNSQFVGNGDIERSGPNGGLSVFMAGAKLVVEDCEFRENRARGRAAGLHVVGSEGGEEIEVRNAVFEGNQTGGTLGLGGGAMYVDVEDGSRLWVEGSRFLSNEATDASSAIQVTTQGASDTRVEVVITDSVFSGNGLENRSGTVRTSFNDESRLRIERSLFNGNFSDTRGVALVMGGGALLEVVNSTFANNRSYDTGTIFSTARETRLAYLTMVGNNHESGGAILTPSQVQLTILDLRGSLIANNQPYDVANVDGTDAERVTMEHNVIGVLDEATVGLAISEDVNLIDAGAAEGLSNLEDRGGATETISVASGHGAVGFIAAADCTDVDGAPMTEDQRGSSRPIEGTCNAGALERD